MALAVLHLTFFFIFLLRTSLIFLIREIEAEIPANKSRLQMRRSNEYLESSTLIDVLRSVLNTSLDTLLLTSAGFVHSFRPSLFLEDRSSSALRLRNPDKWYAGRYHLSVLAFVVFAVSQSRRVMRYVFQALHPSSRRKRNMMYFASMPGVATRF